MAASTGPQFRGLSLPGSNLSHSHFSPDWVTKARWWRHTMSTSLEKVSVLFKIGTIEKFKTLLNYSHDCGRLFASVRRGRLWSTSSSHFVSLAGLMLHTMLCGGGGPVIVLLWRPRVSCLSGIMSVGQHTVCSGTRIRVARAGTMGRSVRGVKLPETTAGSSGKPRGRTNNEGIISDGSQIGLIPLG